MRFIDAHAHLTHNPAGIDAIVESGEFEEIWLMDLSPIGRLGDIELATQGEILDMLKRYPKFFRAWGFLDLDHAKPEDVERLHDLGFMGLKPYKQLKPYSDFSYFPLYAKASELKMPILFHTGLIAQAAPWNGENLHSFGSENMRPSHLAGIAEAFPDLQIVAGHVGWPYLAETEQNLYYYKNISGDISGYLRSIGELPEMLDRRAHDGTTRYFNHKLHFATDQFYGLATENERALKLKKFWEYWFEFIGGTYYRWGLPEEREKFFRTNALEILK